MRRPEETHARKRPQTYHVHDQAHRRRVDSKPKRNSGHNGDAPPFQEGVLHVIPVLTASVIREKSSAFRCSRRLGEKLEESDNKVVHVLSQVHVDYSVSISSGSSRAKSKSSTSPEGHLGLYRPQW